MSMFDLQWMLLAVGMGTAISGSLLSLFFACRGRKTELAAPGGRPVKGALYNLTVAMSPRHKETARNHPVKFAVGILMHVGVGIAMAKIISLLFLGRSLLLPELFVPLSVVAGLSTGALLIRRFASATMRHLSVPDDYISAAVTLVLIAVAALHEASMMSDSLFAIHCAAVLFYVPVGKLKHGVFFFAARADFGARMGYRGTYPTMTDQGRRA